MKDQAPLTAKQHQQRYSKAIQKAKNDGQLAFQAWFDTSMSIDKSVLSGFWDFSVHILTPKVQEYIDTPNNETVLEIGHGGGRLLNAACNYFGKALGIDIHDQNDFVTEFLEGQSKTNFELFRTTGNEIPVQKGTIDFVYSFIVLQHLPSFEVFKNYIAEVSRVLKPGGVGQLYFGKFGQLSFLEQVKHRHKGYKEVLNAEVNHTSLLVHLKKMRQLCRDFNMQVVDSGSSYKHVPEGYRSRLGNQNYVTVVRE